MAQRAVEMILMRHLASHLTTPILIVDPSRNLVFFNEPAEPILGRRFEDSGPIRDGEWRALFKPTDEDGSAVKREDTALFIATERRQPAHSRGWIQGLDGVPHRIEGIAFPLVGQSDRMLGAVGIFWEDEEPSASRSGAEDRGFDAEGAAGRREVEVILMRQLASCLAMPILLVGPDGALLFFNEPAESILGLRFDETGEMSYEAWSAVFNPTAEDGSPLDTEDRPLLAAMRERRPFHRRLSIRGLDGIYRKIEATSFPLVRNTGRPLGAVGIFWDLQDS